MIGTGIRRMARAGINYYQNLSVENKKIVNRALFFQKKKLRSYYTIPTDKTALTPICDSIFLENKKDFEILKNNYLDETVRDKINSVTGYIPYLKSETSIYFYHFFSINYGLRKTLIGQLSLIDENDVVKKVSVIKFPSRFNGVVNLNEVFGETEGVSCILEIYHPRIMNNHAGHQGHLRFWGIYGNDLSTVHSMPLQPFIIRDDKPLLAERRFYPKGNFSGELYFYNFSFKSRALYENLEGDLSLVKKDKYGYTIQLERNKTPGQADFPSSVWHHAAPIKRTLLSKNDSIKSEQLISLPDISGIDCQLFFGEYIMDNQEVEFTLFNSNYKDGLNKRVIIDISNGIQISNIYNIEDLKGGYIIVKPTKNNEQNVYGGFVNIQYIVNKTRCDGVHSHPYTPDSPSQGLKFMHYKVDEFCESFVSIWGLKNSSLEFRMRVIDSKNEFEKCFNIKTNKNDRLLQLNLKDFGIKRGSGIVQIECDKYNPNCTSFIHKVINEKSFLAVCHHTGG